MISKIYKDVYELRLAQLNMRRAQCITLEIARIMDDECIDILLMQKPYNPRGKYIEFIEFGRRVLVVSGGIYFQCSDSIEPYIRKIEEITSILPEEKLIISADVNARSPLWHCHYADTRGEEIELALASRDHPPLLHSGASTIDI